MASKKKIFLDNIDEIHIHLKKKISYNIVHSNNMPCKKKISYNIDENSRLLKVNNWFS